MGNDLQQPLKGPSDLANVSAFAAEFTKAVAVAEDETIQAMRHHSLCSRQKIDTLTQERDASRQERDALKQENQSILQRLSNSEAANKELQEQLQALTVKLRDTPAKPMQGASRAALRETSEGLSPVTPRPLAEALKREPTPVKNVVSREQSREQSNKVIHEVNLDEHEALKRLLAAERDGRKELLRNQEIMKTDYKVLSEQLRKYERTRNGSHTKQDGSRVEQLHVLVEDNDLGLQSAPDRVQETEEYRYLRQKYEVLMSENNYLKRQGVLLPSCGTVCDVEWLR